MAGSDFIHKPVVDDTISFGQKLASSGSFDTLFREGMGLVEEVAAYLDGAGRRDVRGLSRTDALAYASESMRLTTRLMQIASWLLLQRAVNEGEMTRIQATTQKYKINLVHQGQNSSDEVFSRLPAVMRDLVTRSLRLQARVIHLDQLIYGKPGALSARPAALEEQMDRLRHAFAAPSASTKHAGPEKPARHSPALFWRR